MKRYLSIVATCGIAAQCGAQPFLTSDTPRPMAKRTIKIGREFGPETSGTINHQARVPKPRIISRAEWGGGESSSTLMRSQFPGTLTIHHEGSAKPLMPGEDIKLRLRKLQLYGWNQKKWGDLPYHFLIDRDGNIYEGRDPMKVGDTNTKYDPAGKLLVMALGNTEVQSPSEQQINAMCELMAWASDYYNIPPETTRGHMEFTTTQCPGKYLYPYVVSGFFEGEIRKRLAKAYGAEEAVTPAP